MGNNKENTNQAWSNNNRSQKNPFRQKNKNSTNSESNNGQNGNKPKIWEHRFHIHDSAQRNTSESFGKIKEAIILKITKTFDTPLEVAESLKTGTRTVPPEPKIVTSTAATAPLWTAEDALNLEKWKIQYHYYHQKNQKFLENWANTFSLIWENYCWKQLQITIKEISD